MTAFLVVALVVLAARAMGPKGWAVLGAAAGFAVAVGAAHGHAPELLSGAVLAAVTVAAGTAALVGLLHRAVVIA